MGGFVPFPQSFPVLRAGLLGSRFSHLYLQASETAWIPF
jgi:hypothetical protein